MPRPKSKPLTQQQISQIYDLYNNQQANYPLTPESKPPTMLSLARSYGVSISVIHRAIHNEAARRSRLLTT